jgi:hypothetical protein
MNRKTFKDTSLREWGENVDRELARGRVEPGDLDFRFQDARLQESKRGLQVWIPSLRLATACAAAALVAGAGILFFIKEKPAIAGHEEGGEDLKAVYGEIARMFPDQSVWMSVRGSDVEMGMEALPSSTSGSRVFLRVELQKRKEGGAWEEVWRRDIVTSETAWVDTASGREPDQKLSVWTHSPQRGLWMVESHLDLPAPFSFTIRENTLMDTTGPGPAVEAVELRTGWRMIQKMMELPAGSHGA